MTEATQSIHSVLDPHAPVGHEAPQSPTRFCRECGAARQSDSNDCRNCTTRNAARNDRQAALTAAARDRHGIPSALLLYFLLLATCLGGMLFGASTPGMNLFAVEFIMAALVIGWAASQWNQTIAGLWRVPNPKWFPIAIGLSLVTFAIATGVIRGVRVWLDLPPPTSAPLFGFFVSVLATAVYPAIFEELAFRGIILGTLARTLKASEAVTVSAMMFMVLHLHPVRFPHTLALGLATGFVRIRSKSILPCIMLHFSHNLFCVLMETMGG